MRISLKLSIFFLCVAIIPLISSVLISQVSTEQIITNRVSNQLESIASIQKTRINSLIYHTQDKLQLMTNESRIAYLLANLTVFNETKSDITELNSIIHNSNTSLKTIAEISVINLMGKVLVSTNTTNINNTALGEEYITIGMEESLLFDFFHGYKNELFTRHVIPIVNSSTTYGVLVITEGVGEFLNLVQDYSGLGKTGETVIAKRNLAGDALFLTPLKFDVNASLKRTVSKNDLKTPITQALLKNEGLLTEGDDYRNIPVLATTRYIEATDWGVVVKMDKEEAYRAFVTIRNNGVTSLAALCIIIIILTYYFTHSLTKPISKLTLTANEISKGNLTKRAIINSQDEIGDLARSFNIMTESLIEATKTLEQRVKERTAELLKSNTELEQFAYIASHDLQEPLRTISRFMELLSLKYQDKLDSNAVEFINFAVEGAIKMQQLIDDLLEYSRVGTRGKAFVYTNLTEVLENTISNMQLTIGEEGATIVYSSLPSINVDPLQISQLFQNLIGNSIKFRSQELPHISITSTSTQKSHVIKFKDNGIGIESEYFNRIFQVFQRLHTTKEYPGTGIGLAICQKIVERHDGKIWVESELGKGSIFFIELPIKEGANNDS